MDAILTFLLEKFTTIAIIAIGIFVVIRLVWFVAKFYFVRYKNVENKINEIPCNSERRHCDSLFLISEALNSITDDIRGIKYYIIRTDDTTIDELSKKCCPFQLTDIGLVVLEDSGGMKCVDNNLSYFIDEIKNRNPKVALDVEDYALSAVSENLKEDFFNEIKNFVFHAKCPYIKQKDNITLTLKSPITINNVLYVMSIYLRDKFLEKYPEYTTTQVECLVE